MARLSLILVVLLNCMVVSSHAFNITAILERYPNYGLFNDWLSTTGVANEVDSRTSITVLVSSNTTLQSYLSSVAETSAKTQMIADTLRYQILLTYYSIPELQKIVVNNYTEVTTLLQTTGRYNGSQGFVNIYNTGKQFLIGHYVVDSYGNESVVTNVTALPYIYSILEISSVVVPIPPALPSPAPAPSPAVPPSPLASPSSTPATPPVAEGPSATDVTKSHGSVTDISKPLMLLAVLWASGVAGLV